MAKRRSRDAIEVDTKSMMQGKAKRAKTLTGVDIACDICTDMKDLVEFPSLVHKNQQHASNTCSDCWQDHLKAQMESKTADKINCAECETTLSESEIRVLASAELYQKHIDKATLDFMRSDPLLRTCPSGSCNYGYIHTTREDGNIFRCEVCKHRYCILCEVVMHEGQTCAAYQEGLNLKEDQQKNDAASQRYIKTSGSRKCPRCTVNIEKNGGCDHMHCRLCRHDFSWSAARA